MTRAYPSDQKAAALIVLERNRGNVPLTAQQTGISVRTLYNWQCNVLPYLQQYTPPVQNTAELPAFADDLEALSFIRQNIITELSRLSASLQYDAGFSTPYQRALVLSQLMDKLLKLDGHLKPYTEVETEYTFRLAGEPEDDDDDDVWDLSDDGEEVDDEEDA